jgi:hypothetical protein
MSPKRDVLERNDLAVPGADQWRNPSRAISSLPDRSGLDGDLGWSGPQGPSKWEASDRVCGKRLVVMIPTLVPSSNTVGCNSAKASRRNCSR